MAKHEFKFDRKRALNCTLVRKSASHPGEFRYDLEIGDKDGKISHVPAYGKDMQDAISRHIWTERSVKIIRIFTKLENWFAAAWFLTLAIPASVAVYYDSPSWVYAGLSFSFLIFAIVIMFNRYTQKRD